MALHDLAQRSGFTHAVDNVVFLQLELPSSRPELRELFSCQLQVDDGSNEWRKPNSTSLYQQLEIHHGKEAGVIGTIHIPISAIRNVLPDSRVYRPLSLFGRDILLRRVNQDNQPNSAAIYACAINARIRCHSVERLPIVHGDTGNPHGRIWLVRGEILSGGLILNDPRVIDPADANRVWPGEKLRGIFFTGSELQLEAGEKIEKINISNTVLPSQSSSLPLDQVRINQDAQAGRFLFHAHFPTPGATWGDWKTIKNWDGKVLTLDVPYSSQTKPGQFWHYELYRIKTIKRYRLVSLHRNSETTNIRRVVWEQIPATGSISQLFIQDPYGPLSEPAGLPIQPPAVVANDMLQQVQALCDSSRIKIEPSSTQEPTSSRPIVVVDEMDELDEQGKPVSKKNELLRVDWRVTVVGKAGTPLGFTRSVVWQPRTLKITTDKKYLLLDSDPVEAELRGDAVSSAAPASVAFNWTGAGPITPKIPDTRLVGTSLDTAQRQADSRDDFREIWFQANCGNTASYAQQPLVWANISPQTPPAEPVGNGAQATRLSGRVAFSSAGWKMEAIPADPEAKRAVDLSGVQLTLDEAKNAMLELFAADVTLDSPNFAIYREPLNDPKSVPNERQPNDRSKTTPGSLRFIYRPEWEKVGPPATSVHCKHDPTATNGAKFTIGHLQRAISLFLPAERALIDPVSVTRGNLVGRQIVAFPILLSPTDASKFLNVSAAQPSINSQGTPIATLLMELADEEFPDDEKDKMRGFFAQLEPKNAKLPAFVARILKLERDGLDRKKAKLEVATDRTITPGEYRLTVGPTRLALPRDVNHGLIPIAVSAFQIDGLVNGFANLSFSAQTIRGEEGQSVLALHPWSEWGPKPEASEAPTRPWLTTGRVRLHHRNLIQEHSEFESSFEDRFPPEGPAKNPDGSTPSPLLPLADFIRAVRDRYTEATGNVNPPNTTEQAKQILNWLPHCTFTGETSARPEVTMTLSTTDLSVLPEAKLPSPLFDKQSLKLRKANEDGADRHWLDVNVRPETLNLETPPKIRLTQTDPTDVTSRRAVDSSVPLLFSRHEICALATIGLDDGRCIAIVGSPEQSAKSYLFAEDGSISQTHEFPGDAIVDVALLHHSGTVRGLAIRKTAGNDVELIRFTVEQSTGEPIEPTVIELTGTPTLLASTCEDPEASVFVLAQNPTGIFKVSAVTGDKDAIPNTSTNATAIGVDRVKVGVDEYIRYLVIGYDDGHVSVRNDTKSNWPEVLRGDKRLESSPLLGTDEAGLKSISARSIRDLCVLGDPVRPTVVAVDGTRFPCVWGTDSRYGSAARVWLQQSDALSVAFGRVQDLEQRPRFKITEDVISRLSDNGTPAEAIESIQSIKDEEFLSREDFEQKLRELLDAAHEVHVLTIIEHALIDSTVPLFALGLRSGSVRVSAAIGRSEGLTDTRQFEAAETPITRFTMVRSNDTTKPAVCLAGTSAGSLLAWDTRSGMEWGEGERITPTTFLDALGVVRAVPATPAAAADLIVDKLSFRTEEYNSVSTRGLDLVVDQPSGTAAEGITDIRLWADSFKVRAADHIVEPKQFPDGPFDPGHFAFYSEIVADPNHDPKLASLSTFDHLPRLAGIPFFVTAVNELKVKDDLTGIERVRIEGVLINPDEVGSGQDPADVGTLSGVVVRALSRSKPIVVTLKPNEWSLEPEESKIDWTFAVNRQEDADVEGVYQGFPGAIARIVGTVSKAHDGRLSISVEANNSRALAFERLWPLGESVTIHSQASFERTNDTEGWSQSQFSFQSEGDDLEPFLDIPSALNAVPTASLAVDFGNVQINAASITGRLETSGRVTISLGADDAHAQLEQGDYRCFLLDPTECDPEDEVCQVKRGKRALILWTSGDLAGVGFDPTIGPLKLCAALVRMEVNHEQESTPLTFISSSDAEIGKCSATVHQSQMIVEVNSDGTPKKVAMFGSVLIKAILKEQNLSLLLEGNVQSPDTELTGLLALGVRSADKLPATKLQATIRAKVDLAAKTVQLIDDVFWATFVEPSPGTPEPEICLPRPGGITESAAFSVNGFTDKPVTPRGFVRIGLTKEADDELVMGVQTVVSSALPLLPELEPTLVQAPQRVGSKEVRLSHRLRAGLALRPNAPLKHFDAVLNTSTSGKLKAPTATDQDLSLETVVSTAGPLVRLRPEGWLVPSDTSNKYRTEGLFVLNVDFPRDDIPVVEAIEARTRKRDDDEPVTASERDRYRELLRAAGAQGVAISYRLTDEAAADLGFVDSPFYDHSGEVSPDRNAAADENLVGLSRFAALEATPAAFPTWVFGFDPCLRLPAALNDRILAGVTSRYVVADLPRDPYVDICCLAHRQYRLERRRSTTDPEVFDNAETPILHNAEVPAFRQPARLSFPLTVHWLRTNVDVNSPIAASRPFFPTRMDWELAADKPGAMFQSLMQARVTNRDGESRREPLIDFALREPQFIRLADCVTADVFWQKETTISPPENDFTNVDLVWTEVIGNVQVDENEEGDWLKPTTTGIALSRTPLQLVIDFNSEVFLVNQADAAVPAYQVEAQPDEGVPPVKVRPAATYLVANPSVEAVFTPQTVVTPVDNCVISNDGGVWRATVPEGKIQSGTTLTLTDFHGQPELNNVTHRFVGTSNSLFELMQDTAPDDSVPEHSVPEHSFKITVDGNEYDVTIRCRRPFCIEITGDGGTPNDLNAKPFTSAALDDKVRKLKDGEKVIEIRLAQIVPGDKQYLIVTPSQLPTAGSGKCRDVTTQAAGYLESAVRLRTELTADPSKAWTPALTLPKANSDALKLVGEHKLVRIESKSPSANGVFAVLGADNDSPDNKPLARPSVGNGLTAQDEGSACAFLDKPANSFCLKEVTGDTPLLIKLKDVDSDGNHIEDPDWDEGKEIAIRNVTSIPQANGTWVLKKVGAFQYAIFEPPTVEKDVTSIDDAVISAVVPLREAFVQVRDQDGNFIPRLGRLELDPKWEATDRPLLQVHWVGSAQFPNEDVKGIVWRPGGVMVGLYEQVKQVKFLANSQLSPKLAFVMTAPAGTSWQRTILFGDSAPPFKAEPTIEMVEIDGIKTTHFFLKIPNNCESLSVPVPPGVNSDDFVLHLVKSLPSGVAIYDRYSKGLIS